jgi:hypothetical protein
MAKAKRKLSAAEKRARKKRRKETVIIFVNGKQKRVKKPSTINEEFLRKNADPMWLHQNELWHLIGPG